MGRTIRITVSAMMLRAMLPLQLLMLKMMKDDCNGLLWGVQLFLLSLCMIGYPESPRNFGRQARSKPRDWQMLSLRRRHAMSKRPVRVRGVSLRS